MNAKVTILGSGTFFVNEKRSAPAYLLEADNKKILIDCGPGTLMRLSQLNIKPHNIDLVFITHFHADHTSDLFSFFFNIFLEDKFHGKQLSNFPTIFGPKGIYKFMVKLSNAFQLPTLDNWDKIKILEVKQKQTIENIKIESFNVKHFANGISAKANSYRFTIKNKIITFSGDSVNCKGISNSCRNADLFICDASQPKGKANPAHMDTIDIGNIAQKSKVKKIVLSHLYSQTERIDLVKEVKENFSGEVIRSKDFMVFSL